MGAISPRLTLLPNNLAPPIPHVHSPFLTHLTLLRRSSMTAYLARPGLLWLLICMFVTSHLIRVIYPSSSVYMYGSLEPILSKVSLIKIKAGTFALINALETSAKIDYLLGILCCVQLRNVCHRTISLSFQFRCCKQSKPTTFGFGTPDFDLKLLSATCCTIRMQICNVGAIFDSTEQSREKTGRLQRRKVTEGIVRVIWIRFEGVFGIMRHNIWRQS